MKLIACFLVVLCHLLFTTQVCRAVICTTNLGLEYRSEQISRNQLTYSINACCPCRSQPIRYQLKLCGLLDLVTKINVIISQAENRLNAFASSIFGGDESCSQEHHHVAVTYENVSDALLNSYQQLTGIALKFHIIQYHNNSRIGVISGIADDIGDTLCHLQSLLGDTEMSEVVYKRSQTITDMDISQMVPYTCRTLNQNVASLNNMKEDLRTTLLAKLNDFA
ncbi:uncharacterized protein LOC133186930 [Saccostrea echinata]|uniref:uncharacterized protein LOC133186930 n=1 Tax=Saccostrea echinata TaxID=191078 RepID=UPI002A8293E4|nr:uncharacterized protein LOC133186930 [Saccostrea echinata]